MRDGDCAGLIALQRRYGLVGVKMEGSSKSIVTVSVPPDQPDRRRQPTPPEEVERIPLSQSTGYLKIDCNFRDRTDKACFYHSLDGATWTKTAGGFVDFDYYRVSDKISVEQPPCECAA